MRILHLLHNYPPEFRGGVERSVETLTRGLRALGHEVGVFCGSEQSENEARVTKQEHEMIPVWRYHRGLSFKSPVFSFDEEAAAHLERVIDEFRPDVAHVHHHWNLTDDLARRLALRGIPTALTLHDFFTSCALFFRMPEHDAPCAETQGAETCGPCLAARYGYPEQALGALADLRQGDYQKEVAAASVLVAPSQAHATAMERFMGRPAAVLPLGGRSLDLVNKGSGFPDGPLTLLHFGHFSRLKGTELLERAVAQADPDGSRIRLILAGTAVAGEDLRLDRAEVVGDYDEQKLLDLASSSDLAVFPSQAMETYGLVVDEALRMGLPVVVSDRGALSERIGTRGLVARAGSVDALADVLRGILEDPGELMKLRAGQHAPLLDEEAYAQAAETLYKRIHGEGVVAEVDLNRDLGRKLATLRDLLGHGLGQG